MISALGSAMEFGKSGAANSLAEAKRAGLGLGKVNAPVEKEEWDALQPPPDLVAAQRRLEELAKQTLERKQSAQASASQVS